MFPYLKEPRVLEAWRGCYFHCSCCSCFATTDRDFISSFFVVWTTNVTATTASCSAPCTSTTGLWTSRCPSTNCCSATTSASAFSQITSFCTPSTVSATATTYVTTSPTAYGSTAGTAQNNRSRATARASWSYQAIDGHTSSPTNQERDATRWPRTSWCPATRSSRSGKSFKNINLISLIS